MVSYFRPDPLHEDYSCVRLSFSDSSGDAVGSPWLPNRQIRIFSNPAENSVGPDHPSSRRLGDVVSRASPIISAGVHLTMSNPAGTNSFSHHPRNLTLNLDGGASSSAEDDYYCAYDPDDGATEHLNKDFLQMKDDVDKERLLVNGTKAGAGQRRSLNSLNESERHIAIEIETKERQERILRRARLEDLSSIERTGCIFRNGQDRWGRQVVVVVGKWFRPETVDLDKAFLYLVRLLDEIKGPYVVVYFHAGTGAENRPSLKWMRAVYDNLEYRFKKNLKSLFIVHPTMWTKVLCWWFTTFMAPAIKLKLHNVVGLEELYASIEPSQISVPAFISEHDITINGYAGVAYSHAHSSTASTPVLS